MMPIKQFLNKIKYSGKFNQSDITIYYYDRIENRLKPTNYENIKLEDDFLIVNESTIPLHRIKEIRNKGVVIWKRKWQEDTK